GGLGGVHRGASESYDESADLTTLAHVPIAVVCAGVKSILDVGATLERLETLGVAVVGYRTHRFPGFYLADGGHVLDWSADWAERGGQGVRSGGTGGAAAPWWSPPRCRSSSNPPRSCPRASSPMPSPTSTASR